MADKILTKGAPELYTVAEPIPKGEDVAELVARLRATLEASTIPAVGLAANQIGVLRRIIYLRIDGINGAIINPVISDRKGKPMLVNEECLSFPGQRVPKRRPRKILLTGYTERWEPVRMRLRGITAIVVQHEVDHLNGITIA